MRALQSMALTHLTASVVLPRTLKQLHDSAMWPYNVICETVF